MDRVPSASSSLPTCGCSKRSTAEAGAGSVSGWPARRTLLLTTVGRRTEKLRTNALTYYRDGSAWVVVASNGGSDRGPGWLANLVAEPNVTVQDGRRKRAATARVATPEERARLWPLVNRNNRGLARVLHRGVRGRYDVYQRRTEREYRGRHSRTDRLTHQSSSGRSRGFLICSACRASRPSRDRVVMAREALVLVPDRWRRPGQGSAHAERQSIRRRCPPQTSSRSECSETEVGAHPLRDSPRPFDQRRRRPSVPRAARSWRVERSTFSQVSSYQPGIPRLRDSSRVRMTAISEHTHSTSPNVAPHSRRKAFPHLWRGSSRRPDRVPPTALPQVLLRTRAQQRPPDHASPLDGELDGRPHVGEPRGGPTSASRSSRRLHRAPRPRSRRPSSTSRPTSSR